MEGELAILVVGVFGCTGWFVWYRHLKPDPGVKPKDGGGRDTPKILFKLLACMYLPALTIFEVLIGACLIGVGKDPDQSRRFMSYAAGAIAGFAMYLAWHRTRELRRANDGKDRGHRDETFSKAIEHLGAKEVVTRAGGVHCLERLATNHPDEYLTTATEILATFLTCRGEVNRHVSSGLVGRKLIEALIKPAAEVSAAALSLSRIRTTAQSETSVRLHRAPLALLILEDFYLVGADLSKADLRCAWIPRANLEKSVLFRTKLTSANLQDAVLTLARMDKSDLRGARLEGADLEGANLRGANLSGAFLQRANLQKALVTREQVTSAHIDEETKWPGAEKPPWWDAAIKNGPTAPTAPPKPRNLD